MMAAMTYISAPSHSTKIEFSIGEDHTSNRAKYHAVTGWDALVETIGHSPRSPKKGGRHIGPPFKGEIRSKANAERARLLILDLDDIPGDVLSAVEEWFGQHRVLYWPTHSDGLPGKGIRRRALVCLSRAVDADELARIGGTITLEFDNMFNGFKPSLNSFRLEQIGYLPPPGVDMTCCDREPLDADAYLKRSPGPVISTTDAVQKGEPVLNAEEDPVYLELQERDLLHKIRNKTPGTFNIRCPFDDHAPGIVSSTVYMLPNVNNSYGSFKCLHATCAGRDTPDFLERLGLNPQLVWGTQELLTDKGALAKLAEGGGPFSPADLAAQRAENIAIGEGAVIETYPLLTLNQMIERFVFIGEFERVFDMENPGSVYPFATFKNIAAASRTPVKDEGRIKYVQTWAIWRDSPLRKFSQSLTFRAGHPIRTFTPEGVPAMNTWSGFDVRAPNGELAAPFFEHVRWLFGDRADDFIDWLAHIEQKPSELPHTGWLHIAPHHGIGRNWMAAVLARVWRRHVAASLNLGQMLNKGFNGRLSKKVLAIVDEIHEGGDRAKQWAHSETIKSLLTEEMRLINPKCSAEVLEWNSCRWLMFSNHQTALPLDNEDRRFEVVMNESLPQGADYYGRLYGLLGNAEFVAAVGHELKVRDLSKFNPGRHAKRTQAKSMAIEATESVFAEEARNIVKSWPADLITSSDVSDILQPDTLPERRSAQSYAVKMAMEKAGAKFIKCRLRINTTPVKGVWVLRNHEHWTDVISKKQNDEVRTATEAPYRGRAGTFHSSVEILATATCAD